MVLRKMIVSVSFVYFVSASAVEVQKMGSAISKALKTTQAYKSSATVSGEKVDVYYSKSKAGQAERFAVIQKKIYEPNCTHTWVIGVDSKSGKVDDIQIVEMSCHHAFPTKEASFLSQFKGRGPASLSTLKDKTQTIAKATGSSLLTADAVITAIKAVDSIKNSL